MATNWDEIPLIQSLGELHNAKVMAELMGISPNAIHRFRRELGLPYVRIGNYAYFSETQVVHWLNNHQRTVPDTRVALGFKGTAVAQGRLKR